MIERQALVVEAEGVEQRGVEVVHGDDLVDGFVTEVVGVAVSMALLDAAAVEPHREAAATVIAAVRSLRDRGAAEFAHPDHQRRIEQSALLEVSHQRGVRLAMSAAHGSAVLSSRPEQWLAERTEYAARELHECVEFDPGKRGGVPMLKGTRMSVAQLLAELGEGRSTVDVAEDFDLDAALVKRFVCGLAVCLDRTTST